MKHRVRVKKLSKTPAHRKAMMRNMLVAFFRHEQIKTTLAKSKVLQRFAERLISRARTDSVANRRIVAKWVQDKAVAAKLFTKISPLFKERKGGYTRIVKIGQRSGDATEMVWFSLVEFTETPETAEQPTRSKKTKKPEKVEGKKKLKELPPKIESDAAEKESSEKRPAEKAVEQPGTESRQAAEEAATATAADEQETEEQSS